MRTQAIRTLIAEHGIDGFLKIQAQLLGLREDGRAMEGPDGTPILESHVQFGNTKQLRIKPERWSIRGLWEGIVGPCEETLELAQGANSGGFIEHRMREEAGGLASTAFPSAVGMLIATKVIEGYDAPGFVGDQLVTPMPSTLRGERMVGFTGVQGLKEVGEGDEYEDSTFGEKYVTTTETKRGRLISVTEETVFFDQTGEILRRAGNIGRRAREERERRIIRGVADVASTERVYRPGGTAEQLYSGGNSNLLTTATPLSDWTDIQEAMTFHANNITDDRETDDEGSGQPIAWMPTHLLTATELSGVSARIFSAMITTSGNVEAPASAILEALGVGNIKPVSSPYLDVAQGADQWDDASDWLLGDFPRQFIYKEIWPIQTFRAPPQADAQFRRDIIAQFKVREYGDINAVEERLVIKVNAV